MATATGTSAGDQPINFLAHQFRQGEAGAALDFEHMLAMLVHTVEGDAHLTLSGQSDWGIDVLVGKLNGEAQIWQAKYFIRGVRNSQKRQIRESFESAYRNAAKHGYRVVRWVLCLPCSLNPATLQWWEEWSDEQQRRTGIDIALWGETQLRELLAKPEAAHVVRAFYHAYQASESTPAQARLRIVADSSAHDLWAPGAEVRVGTHGYVLHDPVEEQTPADGSWVWREATAEQIDAPYARVRLRQLDLRRPTPEGVARRDGLRAQADLLAEAGGQYELPRLLGLFDETIVTELAAGPSWQDVYRHGAAIDRLTAATALATVVTVCPALAELHRRDQAHRALDPSSLVLIDRLRRVVLRDAGLAGFRPVPGEATPPYRAREQERLVGHGWRPGPPTDVYQLAAIVYHTLTGQPAVPGPNPPIRATLSGFPPEADSVVDQALAPDPSRRPPIAALGGALRQARLALARADPPGGTP